MDVFTKKISGLHIKDTGGKWSPFEQEFLEAHNSYRRLHGSPPLQLSRELCHSAQKWADHLLAIRTLKHSDSSNGENLFYKSSPGMRDIFGKEPVDSWYDEIQNYNFSRPMFQSSTGHFTQVVWKDSSEVGVGKATDGKGLFFVVAQYNPAGNITNPGYFEKNVLRKGTLPSSSIAAVSKNAKDSSAQDSLPKSGGTGSKFSLDFAIKGGQWNQFEKEFLDAHNAYRKQHGAPPLQLSKDLCKSSQKWADHLLAIRTLKHSQSDMGENLYYKQSSGIYDISGKEPVESWYKEIENYNFSRPGFQSNTGHFTQVVWKDSTEVGVGKATDGKGLFFVVGQYSPAGNVTNLGYFEKNVLQKGTPQSSCADTSSKGMKTIYVQDSQPKTDGYGSKFTLDCGASGYDAKQFEQEVLEAHNAYRKQHGAPPLHLSHELCVSSQKWANHLLSLQAMQHSNSAHGENIWYKWSSCQKDVSGREVVDSWYSEIKDYNFKQPGFHNKTGHFTQVVWKDSTELGIAKATDGKGLVIAVAQYSPAGNITNPGYYEKNVLPKGTPVSCNDTSPRMASIGNSMEKGKQSSETDSFVLEFLEANNQYRAKHGAKPLKLNPVICKGAQTWAEHLLSIHTLKHSDAPYGESIWAKTGNTRITVKGQEVADSWYKEVKEYDFSKPQYQENAGHFTQMVWRESEEVGVGKATDGIGMAVIVAQYNPAGNITNPGYFEKNVRPLGTKITDGDPQISFTAKGSKAVIRSEAETKAFCKELLDAHNKYRSLHGVSPLRMNPDLTKEAQNWAEHLVGIQALKNSNTNYGENLWYRWGNCMNPPKGAEVAEAWYNEIQKYNFSTPVFQSGTGNFTQMVWKSSTLVGFGFATDGKGMFIVVGFYDPPGNISNPGYFKDNVLMMKKK
ncbi:uncharacterized protein LOC122790830 [Protopterus annectens]|uniref:uncharacterized protein LOC122790830 n=1 Tax=Protopterus annectens TaxID=7888 RepID=UPI001CF9C343|nr:uncharacterized protein LOC122790830 [Protopterus annectens]XP_043914401.1 uncharacterized protein LOC122790830 [Protopterus annectens]XP_043914402.1 uncharacterized protein LOC122790830 [Protopterus annectens]